METRIRGLLQTQRNLEKVAADLDGEPMVRAMRDATLLIAADAKRNAPVDTGRLKASIHPEIRRERVLQGVVGSVVKYAPYVETGTRPHMPPPAALQTWARRHGTSAWAVALAIRARGTKGHRYLQRAVDANRERIFRLFDEAVGRMVR